MKPEKMMEVEISLNLKTEEYKTAGRFKTKSI
jgi:hypothetical protein